MLKQTFSLQKALFRERYTLFIYTREGRKSYLSRDLDYPLIYSLFILYFLQKPM